MLCLGRARPVKWDIKVVLCVNGDNFNKSTVSVCLFNLLFLSGEDDVRSENFERENLILNVVSYPPCRSSCRITAAEACLLGSPLHDIDMLMWSWITLHTLQQRLDSNNTVWIIS